MLWLHMVLQAELSLELFGARWKRFSAAAVLAAELALLERRPERAAVVPRALPDRQERHSLILAAARAVAEAGAGSQASYQVSIDGLAALLSKLRVPVGVPGGNGAAAPVRCQPQLAAPSAAAAPAGTAATAAAADGEADGLTGPLCNSCWQRGHDKSNRICSNFGKPPPAKPGGFGQAKRVRRALLESSSDEAEAKESEEEDGNANVCHSCQSGGLFECDGCPRSWHGECLSESSRALAAYQAAASCSCPICRRERQPVGFVGNPQRGLPDAGRGGG
jgi:hypothetical protein